MLFPQVTLAVAAIVTRASQLACDTRLSTSLLSVWTASMSTSLSLTMCLGYHKAPYTLDNMIPKYFMWQRWLKVRSKRRGNSSDSDVLHDFMTRLSDRSNACLGWRWHGLACQLCNFPLIFLPCFWPVIFVTPRLPGTAGNCGSFLYTCPCKVHLTSRPPYSCIRSLVWQTLLVTEPFE